VEEGSLAVRGRIEEIRFEILVYRVFGYVEKNQGEVE
jgi:hypothetical protein